MNAVRKRSEILLGAVLAVAWILTIRFLFMGAWFRMILMVLILSGPTLAFARALAVSKGNNAPVKDELADSFVPYSASSNQTVPQTGGDVRYCPSCGAQNEAGGKFCAVCGKALLESSASNQDAGNQ